MISPAAKRCRDKRACPPTNTTIARWGRSGAGLHTRAHLGQHASFACIQARVPRRSCWQHAIHQVDSPRYIIRQLFGAPHSHEVPRPLFGQQSSHFRGHFAGDFMCFADGQPLHPGVSGKIQLQKLSRAFSSQIREVAPCTIPNCHCANCHCARDVEEILALCAHSVSVSPRLPRHRARRRLCIRRAPSQCLSAARADLRRFFRCEQMFRTVQVRAKTYSFVGHVAQLGQAEDLIATGIGQNRVSPRHESVEAPSLESAGGPAANKSDRYCENDVRAQFLEHVLRESLHRRGRAHWHEHRRLDCAVRRRQLARRAPVGSFSQHFKSKNSSLQSIRRK